MAESFTLTKVNYKGEKPNPRGGVLHKHYCTLRDETGVLRDEVYWQSVTQHHEGEEVYGDIEDGEYGPRFRTAQKPDGSGNQGSSGGTFNRHFERVPDNSDRSRRIERQHSQHMALLAIGLSGGLDPDTLTIAQMRDEVREWTDFFVQDLDADLGGGGSYPEPVKATADVSAGGRGIPPDGMKNPTLVGGTPTAFNRPTEVPLEEASPAQKGKLTNLFGKAGLSRDAMKAVVLFRCRSEKATKDGASKLIQDLMDGATHDTLLAEIHDAKRAGDPLAIRAAKLIPSDVPLAEDPEEKAQEYEDESGVPF